MADRFRRYHRGRSVAEQDPADQGSPSRQRHDIDRLRSAPRRCVRCHAKSWTGSDLPIFVGLSPWMHPHSVTLTPCYRPLTKLSTGITRG